MKNSLAFTFIELIVSISILTISVFGIYRLVGGNQNIISKMNLDIEKDILFTNSVECIKTFSGASFSGYLDFSTNLDTCSFSTIKNNFELNNVEYNINLSSTYSGALNIWNINIYDDLSGEKQYKYIK